MLRQGYTQIFHKSRNHLKIQGARWVTRKFCTEDPQILGVTT